MRLALEKEEEGKMYRGNLATNGVSSKTKTCPRCRNPLPLEAFDPNKARRDGRQVHCRKCRKAQRELVKAGPRNGNGRSNGHRHSNGYEASAEGSEDSGYTPIWKKASVNKKELLLQREHYMNIINAASLALDKIEARLGISSPDDAAEDATEETAPPEVAEDLSQEELEDNLG